MTLGRRVGRLRRAMGRRMVHAALQPLYGTAPYRMTLPQRAGPPTGFVPTDMWPGESDRGGVIVRGDFELGGSMIRDADAPWTAGGISRAWLASVSEFEWLRDLRASGGEAARSRARTLVMRWIDTHGVWHRVAWQPGTLGARIASWLGHYEFLSSGADPAFRAAFLVSVRRQVRHLHRVLRYAPPGADRIVALKGLIYAALAFDNRKPLARLVRALESEIALQILSDGGHVSRNPSQQLAVLRHFIDVRTALHDSQEDVPQTLQTAIDRMAPMVRFFRHGDGGLALFNGSQEEEDWVIDVVLTRSEARGKPLESAPHTGFERLTANRTLVLMDAGTAPEPGYDTAAHAGLLSFEMSVGKERLVVNCGAHHGDAAAWRVAQRTTAAHSTVTVEDVNSAEVLPGGGFGARQVSVLAERKEADGDIWISSSHDGYRAPFGLEHHRRLYLAANGSDLRGEDTLTGSGSHKFVVRFHLHPSVRASIVQEGHAVLLRLPSGPGWRFRASGGVISLQESVYLGSGHAVKRSEQIVVSAATQGTGGQVKWAFSQLVPRDE